MRRIIILAVLAMAMLLNALPAFAGPFTDVPTDHWAYDAIDKLQAEGFVEGYPDGTFRGNRSFTRYEMAMVVARIWDRLVFELESIGDLEGNWATQEDLDDVIDMLEDLRDEFYDELDMIDRRLTDIEDWRGDTDGRLRNLEDSLSQIQMSGVLRTRIEDIITNEYAGGAGFGGGFFRGTPGANPGEMFEVEGQVWLALDAMPSDYLDVHISFLQVLSYLDTVGMMPLFLDEAWARADMMKLMGWEPTELFNRFNLVVGRQYARFGEFGMAFDNGWETRPGVLIDLGGDNLELAAFIARSHRTGLLASYNPVTDTYIYSNQDGQEGLGIARVSYGFGESRSIVEPGNEFARIGFNYLATGVGNEQGMGLDVNTELLGSVYLNRLRVEYFQMSQDQVGYNVSDEYGDDFEGSLIAWVDLYNNGNTRVSAAYADIGLTPGFSSIDNNPFEEYDMSTFVTTPSGRIGDNTFYGYESGLNPFPNNFVGIGVQIDHTWWDVLNTVLTFYDGTNQAEQDLPVVIRLNVRYPLSDASDIALEYIHSGIDNLTLAKLRGEFLVRF